MPDPGLLILSATEFEVAGFLREFSPKKEGFRSGVTLFKEEGWHCLVTGPGVFNTALGLGAYLERYTPNLILDTGIAGAFEGAGLVLGDIGIALGERYLHTGVGNDPLSRSPLPFALIPDHPETARGIYDLDSRQAHRWAARLARDFQQDSNPAPRIVTGPFLTVSALTRGQGRADRLYSRFSPIMESMEGAAAAHCALGCNIPIIEIRAASNLVGERDKSRWDFPLACDRVRLICRAALAVQGSP